MYYRSLQRNIITIVIFISLFEIIIFYDTTFDIIVILIFFIFDTTLIPIQVGIQILKNIVRYQLDTNFAKFSKTSIGSI